MRAPFAYYGGKINLAARIVPLIPDHRVYVEPFLGSGALFFAKPPTRHEILNDLDDGVWAFFTALRCFPAELEHVCRLTPYSETEFLRAYPLPDLPDPLDLKSQEHKGLLLERARCFWVRVTQSVAHHSGPRTGFSVTAARSQSSPDTVRGRLDRFVELAERLSRATILRRDAIELLASRLARRADAFIYVDPPYLASTRVQRTGTGAGDYLHELPESRHRELAEVLVDTPATVFVSGYPNDLYDKELFAGWHVIDFETVAQSSSNSPRRARVERVWSNRPFRLPATQDTLFAA